MNTHPRTFDFERLRQRIAHGWWKLNHDGSRTLVGEPPHHDLYWAVRSLDRRFPVHPDLSPVFDKLARTIAKLYPERVRTEIGSPYVARIVVFEFNDDPRTTQDDLLHVARRSGREDGLSPCLSRRMLQVLAAVNEPAQPP
jgi:hypothetical protein